MKIDGVEIPDEKLIEAGWTPPAKKEVKKRWRGDDEHPYFYINLYGNVTSAPESRYTEDNARYLLGNYYSSKKEAEKARDKQLAYMRLQDALLEYSDGWEPDWSDGEHAKYVIYWNHRRRAFVADKRFEWQYEGVFVGTKEACERLIKEHEDDLRAVWGLE